MRITVLRCHNQYSTRCSYWNWIAKQMMIIIWRIILCIIPMLPGISHLINSIVQIKSIWLVYSNVFNRHITSSFWLSFSHFSISHLKLLRGNILAWSILWLSGSLFRINVCWSRRNSILICKGLISNLLNINSIVYLAFIIIWILVSNIYHRIFIKLY